MNRCATCKIRIHPSDKWCDHCWPAAIDREQNKVASSKDLIAKLDDPRIAGAVNEKGGGRWS